MGWWIGLGVIALLAVLPLGVSAKYDEDGPGVWVIAGPVRIPLYPGKKREQTKKAWETASAKGSKPREAAQKDAPQAASGEKKGGSWRDFLPLARVALDFLNDLRRRLRVNRLELNLTMAAEDPCDLAVNYGRANGAMATLLSQLERFLVIKKRDVHINCDFTAEETVIMARLELTIPLGRLLVLGVCYGIRALKTVWNIKKQREGGANL